MNSTMIPDLSHLAGKTVLVKSARDRRNPPIALRGTMEVSDQASAARQVRVVMEFPDMFNVPAHRRTITLDDQEIRRLLASEREGIFALTIDGDLD